MKKVTILLFSLIAIFAIILFFFFKDKPALIEEKKNKVIQQEKTLEKKETAPKEVELKLTLEPSNEIDKSKFKKNEDYKEAVPLGQTSNDNKQKDLDVNIGVDINKEKKTIEGVELNIQKKF